MSIHKTSDSDKRPDEVSFEIVNNKERIHTAILIVLLFVFSGLSAFALGRLSVGDRENQRGMVVETVAPLFEEMQGQPAPRGAGSGVPTGGAARDRAQPQEGAPFLVGSRHSDRYHFPWCPGARRIKPENLVTFSSFEEARRAGYVPARNCPGLE